MSTSGDLCTVVVLNSPVVEIAPVRTGRTRFSTQPQLTDANAYRAAAGSAAQRLTWSGHLPIRRSAATAGAATAPMTARVKATASGGAARAAR